MKAKATKALLRQLSADLNFIKDAVKQSATLQIAIINRGRLAGMKIQEACGREQVSFDFFRANQAELPPGSSFEMLKFCVHLSRKLDKPVETLDEARAVQRDLFIACGEMTAPKRLTEQSAHEHNPWSDFISGASSFMSLFEKLEAEPMESWDRTKLGAFVRETAPIAEKHQKAALLLNAA